MKEIKSLTGLRGLAALYVATYHFFHPYKSYLSASAVNFLTHGYVSVDMFFILSGFVMTLSSKKLFDNGFQLSNYTLFMKRRFARIYPIYFINIIVAFFFLIKVKGIKIIVVHLLLIQVLLPIPYIIGPAWSLSAEWLAYLIFPVMLALVYKYKGNIWNIVCLAVSFGAISIVSVIRSHWFNGFMGLQDISGDLDRFRGFAALLRCFAEYIIGIALFKLYVTQKDKYSQYYHYMALPCCALLIALLFVPNSDIALVFLFAVLIISLSIDRGVVARFFYSKPLYFLGEISYSLYLVHTLFIKGDKEFYSNLLSRHIAHPDAISFFAFYICLIGISYLTYKFIEIPARDYLKGRAKC